MWVLVLSVLLASSVHANQEPPHVSFVNLDQEMPGVTSPRMDQKLPGLISPRTDQELPRVTSPQTDQKLFAVTSKRTNQKLSGVITPHTNQELPGVTTPRTSQELSGVTSKFTDQKLTVNSPRTDQDSPIVTSLRTDQDLPRVTSPRSDQDSSVITSPRTDQDLPGVTTPHTDQDLPRVTSPPTDQYLPGVTTPRTDQDLPRVTSPRTQDSHVVTLPRTDQNLPRVTSPRSDQDLPGVTTPRTHQDLPDVTTPRTGQDSTEVTSPRIHQELPDFSSVQSDQKAPDVLRCRHEQCLYLGYNITDTIRDTHYYEIEGNKIQISTLKSGFESQFQTTDLRVECNGANVLGSTALPSFEHKYEILRGVELERCPLPATGSLQNTLTAFNSSFCEPGVSNEQCELWLLQLPSESPLRATHFVGLGHVHRLTITVVNGRGSAERDFLIPLKSLRTLAIKNVTLPDGTMDALPSSLDFLVLNYINMRRLPEAILSLPNLETLLIVEEFPLDAVSVPPAVHRLELISPATSLQLDATSALETLWLYNWVEPQPPLMTRCAALRELHFQAPAMHALPEKWLWNCTLLKELEILQAQNLITLPPRLFSPGTQLQRLGLKQGALETLPAGLLHDVRPLKTLELNNNRLKMLPSNLFVKYFAHIAKVDMSWNDLDHNVFSSLRDLNSFKPSLTELDLSHNPRIGDVCKPGGSSALWRQRHMLKLDLSNTGISRICKDWREFMPELRLLDLRRTNITELSFEDLQYTRTTQAQVRLQGAPVATLRVTREDYNKALRVSPSFTSVEMDAAVDCDCQLYWARRGLEHTRAQLALPGVRELRCVDGRLLRELPPEELVCPAPKECQAVALPAEFECAARPDDDPEQDRWIVHVRCRRSTQNLVPRRLYPYYPYNHHKNQGAYLTEKLSSR